ncbi:MAG TPA: carboxymuconolactone decarboxylase family protein [Steroidobacteraceae bacterium]
MKNLSPRLHPLKREDVPELEEYLRTFERRMGFVPNSILTMARRPKIVKALAALGQAIYDVEGGVLPMGLKSMVAELSSRSTGCLYCQAHFSTNMSRMDVADERIEALWEYRTNNLFSAAEKAAFEFAVAASMVPNAVTDDHFLELRQHYTEEQIVELLATIGYVGYLNRWNDSMATPLEDFPSRFAKARFGERWDKGKHDR